MLAGYGTEAISYVAGMLQSGMVAPEDLWITQVRMGALKQASKQAVGSTASMAMSCCQGDWSRQVQCGLGAAQ